MSSNGIYKPRQFNLSSLKGISDETLEIHFKLYEGYVKKTNKLNEKIAEFVKGGKVDQEESAEYSELGRRLGFEYNASRNRKCRRFQSGAGDGCLGTRVHTRLQTGGSAEIHRSILLEH